MAKNAKKTKELEAEMQALRDKLKAAKEQEELSFGRIARKVGLLDLDLSSKAMTELLSDAKARFQGHTAPEEKRSQQPDGQAGTA